MEQHNLRVAKITSKIKDFYHRKVPWRVYHGGTHSTRKTTLQSNASVDTSDLCDVLRICTAKMTVLVEPNIHMEALVRETLRYGLLPPVVPEFPCITVGGAFAGTAAESSSFKYGFFESTVNWIEIVLPNGDITIASEDSEPDLFHGAAGTFGTLGVTTLLELQLIEAKPFVQLTYYPFHSIRDAVNQTQKATKDPVNDFVDGIVFNRNLGALIIGRLIKQLPPNVTVKSFRKARDEWYYLHVEQLLCSTISPKTEAVTIEDYLFRYDRGAFWAGHHVFSYFALPYTHFMRWALDSLMRTKILYHGLHENGMARNNIIQDVVLPISQAQSFIEWTDDNYAIYPLWLCPLRQGNQESFYPSMDSAAADKNWHELWNREQQSNILAEKAVEIEDPKAVVPYGNGTLMNVGVWGPRLHNTDEFVAENRKLEHKVRQLGGMKWLYAHCHYTMDEFWSVYDKERYDKLRSKYNATYLPSVYDKTRFDWDAERITIQTSWLRWLFGFIWWIWPVPGIYGVLCVFMNSDYLLYKQ